MDPLIVNLIFFGFIVCLAMAHQYWIAHREVGPSGFSYSYSRIMKYLVFWIFTLMMAMASLMLIITLMYGVAELRGRHHEGFTFLAIPFLMGYIGICYVVRRICKAFIDIEKPTFAKTNNQNYTKVVDWYKSTAVSACAINETPEFWPNDFGPGWQGDPDSYIDQQTLKSYVGKSILIGITYCDPDGDVLFDQQLHGVVEQSSLDGILISLRGRYAGKTWNMPPVISLSEGSPGVYTLKSTGEEVKDPDLLGTWTVTKPKLH
jgi:hypothetical protein